MLGEPEVSQSLASFLREGLDQRQFENRYRKRPILESSQGTEVLLGGGRVANFCSNDYLGLASHPKVQEAFVSAAKQWGVGSGASHLVCGHSRVHHQLEEALAAFTGRERALLFSTGYMANLGVINALTDKCSAIIEDKLNHASLIDAAQLSAAHFQRFRHNDIPHLRSRLLHTEQPKKLIVVDGVFSMDGDMALLPEMVRAADEYNAWLMVDDAHGFGVLGEQGRGIAQHFQLGPAALPIYMATLGKALGTFGAFVAGSQDLIEYCIQFARPYVYTTAMPPAVAASTLASLQLLQQEPEHRLALLANIERFKHGARSLGLPILPSETAIQPLVVGDESVTLELSARLLQKQLWVSAIRPPTVPVGTSRLRITLSAKHTSAQIDRLLSVLSEELKALQVHV